MWFKSVVVTQVWTFIHVGMWTVGAVVHQQIWF